MFLNILAMAGSREGQSGGDFSFLFVMVAIFAIFYFLIIMPQKKKQKKHQAMVHDLKKGDKVVTSGGIHGMVHTTKPDTLVIKIADNVKIEVNKANVSQIKDNTE